jgi:hypothetical protein
MNVLPFFEEGIQKYYVSWSSSSGSDNGWQHDIYNQIISFTSEGEIIFNTNAHRYIGTGYDEAQEPVNIAIDPFDNTMLSVWEDGSGNSVDIHGQLHKPDGTIIKSNWIISGGSESQHSPDVVHLLGLYVVSLTDEAPPALTSMNEVRILDDKTGEQIGSMELSPREEDHWWAVSESDNNKFAFIGWGNGDNFYGSVIKAVSDTISKTSQNFYVSNIEQYNYNIAWLENLSKFIAIVKANDNSIACLIDTNGVRSAFSSIPNAPITRETDIAVKWDEREEKYLIIYTSGMKDITLLSVSSNKISLIQINQNILTNTNWPTTGISCQFIHAFDGKDLWYSARKILIVHNDENSNNAIYCIITVEDLTIIINDKDKFHVDKFALYPAYPNPFSAKSKSLPAGWQAGASGGIPMTVIPYSIDEEQIVKIQVFNLQGQEIETLVNENKSPGNYKVTFTAKTLPSGIYIYCMRTKTKVLCRKMLLLR